MEHFFLAEGEFQSKYLMAPLDEVSGEMQPPRFPPGSLGRAINEARRGLKEASPRERIVSNEGDRWHRSWANLSAFTRAGRVVPELHVGQTARLPGTI